MFKKNPLLWAQDQVKFWNFVVFHQNKMYMDFCSLHKHFAPNYNKRYTHEAKCNTYLEIVKRFNCMSCMEKNASLDLTCHNK